MGCLFYNRWYRPSANVDSKLSLHAFCDGFLVPFSFSQSLGFLSSKTKECPKLQMKKVGPTKQLQPLRNYGCTFAADMSSVTLLSLGGGESNGIVFVVGESPITIGLTLMTEDGHVDVSVNVNQKFVTWLEQQNY